MGILNREWIYYNVEYNVSKYFTLLFNLKTRIVYILTILIYIDFAQNKYGMYFEENYSIVDMDF